MTPELPRAPISAPKLIAAAIALDRDVRDGLRLVERGLHGRVHVRAGVAVGNRVDVEAVDLVDVGLEVGDGRPERVEQAGAVAGAAGHQATSVPLAARSSVADAGSARPAAAGRSPGW